MDTPARGWHAVMFLGLYYVDKLERTTRGWRITERVEEASIKYNVPRT